MLTIKEERIKVREGERLYRSLRRAFKNKFGFDWTNDDTSYYDGKDIYVKYDMQSSRTRIFNEAEIRSLRISHGFHEAGHAEFDYLQDYIDWQKEYMAEKQEEVLNNKKYPSEWLQFFGNMSMDGRMERLVKIKCPSQTVLLDLNNYEWRFGYRLDGLGESKTNDFRHAFAHRVLGMEDVEAWHPESVELLDSVMDEIDLIRRATTTKKCLTHVTTLIIKVWPTILEWGEFEVPSDQDRYEPSNHRGKWAKSAEAAQDASEHLSEGEEPIPSNKEQMEQALKRIAKEVEKEIQAMEKEEAENSPKEVEVNLNSEEPGVARSETVQVLPILNSNKAEYTKSLQKVKRHIKPVSKELRGILEGVPDQVQRNSKSGRLMPSQVWRATYCEDKHVFTRNLKGEPSINAFIGLMNDISGSTGDELNGSLVIQQMREALILLIEAATLADIPNVAYAFTEMAETIIFPLKTNPIKFSEQNKEAIGGIQPMGGNRDTLALQYLLDQIDDRSERIRLAIMISDGIPCFEGKETPATITQMVKGAEKKGIDVLCLFVGREGRALDTAKVMYPGRVIHADKNVAKQLQIHVKRIMRIKK